MDGRAPPFLAVLNRCSRAVSLALPGTMQIVESV